MTDTTAADTAAPAEDTKANKKEKAPKPQSRYWVGPTASREGAVYHRLQVLVAENPGMNRDELITKLQESGFTAKNSRKFEDNPSQFIGGYLTAGERKGFFVSDESKALDKPNVATVAKKEPSEKGPSVTDSGKAILEALRDGLGDRFAAGEGLPIKEVGESLNKTKSQLSRSLDKLVKEKFVEIDTTGEGDEATDYVYVMDAGVNFINGAEPSEA